MVRAGRRSLKGHLATETGGSRSFCGRTLGGGLFTDENDRPDVCVRCVGSFERKHRADHHHVVYREGRWAVAVPQPTTIYVSSVLLYSSSSVCGIDGCTRQQRDVYGGCNGTTTLSSNTFDWRGNAA